MPHDATIYRGAMKFTAGRFGQALDCTADDVLFIPGSIDSTTGTIEGRILTTTTAEAAVILGNNDFNGGIWFGIRSGRLYISFPGTLLGDGTGTLVNDGQWHHVAVTFDGTHVALWVDGVAVAAVASAAQLHFGTGDTTIGSLGSITTYDWVGLIDELRISGVSRYSANFTPAAGPFVGDASTTALYHFDGDATDSAAVTAAPTPTATVSGVSVSPAAATVAGGATQQFAATVAGTNGPSQSVTWSRSPAVGSISSAGLFTAPAAASAAQTITATATATADTSKSGSATITVPAAASAPTATTKAFAPDSPAFCFTALSWDDDGSGTRAGNAAKPGASAAWTTATGSTIQLGWSTATGSTCKILVDTTPLEAGGVPIGYYPAIAVRFGTNPEQRIQVGAGTNGVWAADLSASLAGAGSYSLRVQLVSLSINQDRWSAVAGKPWPANCLKVNGLVADADAVAVAPTPPAGYLLIYGDSLVEGVRVSGVANDAISSNDARYSFAGPLAAALGYAPAALGYGGQGWTYPGVGSVPNLVQGWTYYSAGRPRDFSRPPAAVLVAEGTNDVIVGAADAAVTAAAAGFLPAVRAKLPAAPIYLAVPPGGFKRAALTAAMTQYQAAAPDARASLLDGGAAIQPGLTGFVTGGTFCSPDGIHPLATYAAPIAATYAAKVATVGAGAAGTGTTPTPTVTPAAHDALTAADADLVAAAVARRYPMLDAAVGFLTGYEDLATAPGWVIVRDKLGAELFRYQRATGRQAVTYPDGTSAP